MASNENNFFFFAVTGIHATMWGIDLLDKNYYLHFLMNECYEYDASEVYQETFCHLLIKFTYLWSSQQRDIMDFNTVTDEFLEQIKQDRATELKETVLRSLQLRKKNK